ncbi:interference hedgehog-like [Panonychus citri]|uniref:interference hedgehog-like n=1 Tax=Panonychus citri TaxID=50023 RepID=UPI002306EC51|nr:interference hedgehog-like [Panonychus citri]
MDLQLWLWLIVTHFLLPLTVSRRLRNTNSQRGLTVEVQSEMISYMDNEAILKCITSPLATIDWLVDGLPITNSMETEVNQRFKIDKNELIISLSREVPRNSENLPFQSLSQKLFKSRFFQCKSTFNGETIISEPAKVIITFLNDFDAQSDQEINIIQGNTAVIPCKKPKSIPTAIMEYYFNQTLIKRSDDHYLLTSSGNLQIIDSRPSDSGIYRCNAFLQERRNASWTIKLNVFSAQQWSDLMEDTDSIHLPNESAKNIVQFTVFPANLTKAVMGTNVTLECVAQGIRSLPKINWLKKRDGGGEKVISDSKKYRKIAGNLVLTSIDESDSGIYICRASMDDISIETSAIVDVQSTPRFVKSLQNVKVDEGKNFTLECQSTGNPKPEIDWFFNGKLLTKPQSQLSPSLSIEHIPGVTINEQHTELIVTNARSSIHSGIFQCFASNELNNDYKSTYSLSHVKVLLSRVESLDNSRISEADKSINQKNPSTISILDDIFKPNGGGENNSKERERGRGRKRHGKPMIPPSKPKVNRLSDYSVMVYWELSNKTSLPVSFFKLQYKESGPKSTWNTLSEDIAPWITTQTVSGLVPDSKYRFRVMAVFNNSDYRESPVSDKFHLIRTSMLKKPKDAPNIIAVVPQSSTQIQVIWDNYKESSTSIEGFIIHYRATSSAGDYFQITLPTKSTKFNHIVSQLSPATSYEFKLQVFNSAGVSEYSKILTGSTFDDPVSTTTEIITVIKVGQNLDSHIENNYHLFLLIVGGIGAFALSVFIVCCIVQCAGRYKQSPQRKKDNGSIPTPQLTNGDLNNSSLLIHNHHHHHHHRTNQSFDEYKRENDIIGSHCDKSSSNNVTASVSIDHFPIDYNQEINEKRNNYQTRTYMIDSFCEESPYGVGGRTGSWSRKSRKKCFETDAGVKLIATASSHNSLQRKYLYENQNEHHVPSTLERRRSTFKSEEHLKCSLNARIHSKSSSFTKLDGTLERKKRRSNGTINNQKSPLSPQSQPPPVPERSSHLSNHRSLSSSRLNGSLEKRKKSRTEYVNTNNTNMIKNGNHTNQSQINSYNGTINHINNSKPPLLIMQSTC